MRYLMIMLAFLTLPALAQDVAAQAGLNAAQVKKLRGLGFQLVVPTYTVPGYKLHEARAEYDQRFGNSYKIEYRNAAGHRYAVQASNGGIGDGPSGDKEYPFTTQLFGAGKLQWSKADDVSPEGVWSGWMSFAEKEFPVYSLFGTQVKPEEAVKVLESLRKL